jgi:glyoxylase-like metal-dependent hydrolase (beta-lactamase superfamily II)
VDGEGKLVKGDRMYVERVEVTISPGFVENCYLVSETPEATHVIIVDPGAQPKKILEAVGDRVVDSIVLTHRHYDHTGALRSLVKKTQAELIAYPLDSKGLPKDHSIKTFLQSFATRKVAVTRTVDEDDFIAVGDGQLRVLHTPGHTIDSICLYDEKDHILIAGDTLFYGAVGRTDLPTGDAAQQRESLRKLIKLPDDTAVHPGHDADTTIGRERRYGYLGFLANVR